MEPLWLSIRSYRASCGIWVSQAEAEHDPGAFAMPKGMKSLKQLFGVQEPIWPNGTGMEPGVRYCRVRSTCKDHRRGQLGISLYETCKFIRNCYMSCHELFGPSPSCYSFGTNWLGD